MAVRQCASAKLVLAFECSLPESHSVPNPRSCAPQTPDPGVPSVITQRSHSLGPNTMQSKCFLQSVIDEHVLGRPRSIVLRSALTRCIRVRTRKTLLLATRTAYVESRDSTLPVSQLLNAVLSGKETRFITSHIRYEARITKLITLQQIAIDLHHRCPPCAHAACLLFPSMLSS